MIDLRIRNNANRKESILKMSVGKNLFFIEKSLYRKEPILAILAILAILTLFTKSITILGVSNLQRCVAHRHFPRHLHILLAVRVGKLVPSLFPASAPKAA